MISLTSSKYRKSQRVAVFITKIISFQSIIHKDMSYFKMVKINPKQLVPLFKFCQSSKISFHTCLIDRLNVALKYFHGSEMPINTV